MEVTGQLPVTAALFKYKKPPIVIKIGDWLGLITDLHILQKKLLYPYLETKYDSFG
jgi:hypothetical protein